MDPEKLPDTKPAKDVPFKSNLDRFLYALAFVLMLPTAAVAAITFLFVVVLVVVLCVAIAVVGIVVLIPVIVVGLWSEYRAAARQIQLV